ncbi:Rnase H [Erwinia phage vB_EamM-Bue1]|uniref:ribonuclease H n=1 Tax=Erwinia phage vB_EamM-Bue1 TaxID=2099338 RepID=A0A2P1JU94_9CAUD|nr:Rnase H [Erwinia phage vB_EamM-Bue1]AVO22926.1 ribonuclease HI [Erwinia phage vB_EamM-Bue1]
MIEIYTDGSSNPKTNQAAGWAFAISPLRQDLPWSVYFGHLTPPSTNNIGEMTAVLNSMKLLYHFSNGGSRRIPPTMIYSDSQYTLKGLLEWRAKWEYQGMPEKNVELWLDMFATHDLIKPVCDLSFKWVKGHAGIKGNELADTWCGHGKRDSDFSLNNNMVKTTKIIGDIATHLHT